MPRPVADRHQEELPIALATTEGRVKEMDRLLLEARRVIRRPDPTVYQRITNAS